LKPLTIIGWLIVFVFSAAGCNQSVLTAANPPDLPSVTPTSAPIVTNLWNDRELFRSGLIEAAKGALAQLPGASEYHLDIQIADNITSLQGQEQVLYTNQEDAPLNELYFQLFPNMMGGGSSVSAIKIDGQEAQPVYQIGNSAVRIPLTTPLQPGKSILVQMDFKVDIPTEAAGNYGLFGYIDNILVLDGFYPAIPVYDAKGWHEGLVPPNSDSTFQDASFYVVRVTAPAALTLVTSGVEIERSKNGQQQVVTFAAGPARDFYIAASDHFTVHSETSGETRVNSYAFKNQAKGAQAALDTAVKALSSYSARFGAYPYTEFDVVSTPMQGAYGIEYPGITGINKGLYDLDATISGTPSSVYLESTVAHEVGHQWFYNMVGNDQANEPWLDEAVTQYVTGLYYLDEYGKQAMDGFQSSWSTRWGRVNRELLPIGLPAGDYSGREYGAIVYGRGPMFVAALAQEIGQTTFDQFLRDYTQTTQWGIGTTASFKLLAEKDCKCDLTPLFDEWVYKK
jgi:hypothetical protein